MRKNQIYSIMKLTAYLFCFVSVAFAFWVIASVVDRTFAETLEDGTILYSAWNMFKILF